MIQSILIAALAGLLLGASLGGWGIWQFRAAQVLTARAEADDLQAFARSTLLAKFRAGDREGARAEFARWVHAGGEVLPGLVVRRALEAARMS